MPVVQRYMFAAVSAILIQLAVVCALFAQEVQTTPQPVELTFHDALLRIKTNDRLVEFRIEAATNEPTRNQGLMFRQTMADDQGMLFVFDKAERVSFWMKNTLIPLDMIFVDETGAIVSIYPNAAPGSLVPISPDVVSKYVFEINGGLSAKLGLSLGQKLEHPLIAGQ